MSRRVGSAWLAETLRSCGVAVICGPDLYAPALPIGTPNDSRVRAGGKWIPVQRAGLAWQQLVSRLLEEGPEARTSWSFGEDCLDTESPPAALVGRGAGTGRLYRTARTLCFIRDVEEQLERLARGEAVEDAGPAEGPHVAALPRPTHADPQEAAWSSGSLPDPSVVLKGVLYELKPAAQCGRERDGDVMLDGRFLRRGQRVATCGGIAALLRKCEPRPDQADPALKQRYVEIIEQWQRRIEKAVKDSRVGWVLREFRTPDALFRLVALPRRMAVTLDVPSYVICDRLGRAYRFDECVLASVVSVPSDNALRASRPRVMWPRCYESPFVASGEAHPRVCTGGFLDSRRSAQRHSHTIIDWLLCTRHVLRAGYFDGGHSPNPYQEPSAWPGRQVDPQQARRAGLTVFRYARQ